LDGIFLYYEQTGPDYRTHCRVPVIVDLQEYTGKDQQTLSDLAWQAMHEQLPSAFVKQQICTGGILLLCRNTARRQYRVQLCDELEELTRQENAQCVLQTRALVRKRFPAGFRRLKVLLPREILYLRALLISLLLLLVAFIPTVQSFNEYRRTLPVREFFGASMLRQGATIIEPTPQVVRGYVRGYDSVSGAVRMTNMPGDSNESIFPLSGDRHARLGVVDDDAYLGLADMVTISEFITAYSRVSRAPLNYAVDNRVDLTRRPGHLICVGGPGANRISKQFLLEYGARAANYRFRFVKDMVKDKVVYRVAGMIGKDVPPMGKYSLPDQYDTGIVIRAENPFLPSPGNTVLVIAGWQGEMASAFVRLLAEPQRLKRLLSGADLAKGILVRAEKIGDTWEVTGIKSRSSAVAGK